MAKGGVGRVIPFDVEALRASGIPVMRRQEFEPPPEKRNWSGTPSAALFAFLMLAILALIAFGVIQ